MPVEIGMVPIVQHLPRTTAGLDCLRARPRHEVCSAAVNVVITSSIVIGRSMSRGAAGFFENLANSPELCFDGDSKFRLHVPNTLEKVNGDGSETRREYRQFLQKCTVRMVDRR